MDWLEKEFPGAVIRRVKIVKPDADGGDWLVSFHVGYLGRYHVCLGRGPSYKDARKSAERRVAERLGNQAGRLPDTDLW